MASNEKATKTCISYLFGFRKKEEFLGKILAIKISFAFLDYNSQTVRNHDTSCMQFTEFLGTSQWYLICKIANLTGKISNFLRYSGEKETY